MGTSKRERQKRNRSVRRDENARRQQRSKVQRRGARIGIVAIIVIALVGFVFVTGQSPTDQNADDTANTTETSQVAPGEDTASADTDTPDTEAEPLDFVYGTSECPPDDGSATQRREFEDAHQLCIDPVKAYSAVFETNLGSFTVRLRPDLAPGTVNNFVALARWKYFDGTKCHRVIENFVVQCGDPTATGTGSPGYSFADELPAAGDYAIGSLAMANSGPNTNGSQFFIITGADGAALPPNYSLFGEVTEGLDTAVAAMAALFNPDPAANGVPPRSDIVLQKVTITEA